MKNIGSDLSQRRENLGNLISRELVADIAGQLSKTLNLSEEVILVLSGLKSV